MPSTIPLLGFAEPVSSWLHLGAAAAALVLSPTLIRLGRTRGERVALGIFVFAAAFAMTMSGVYHMLEWGSDGRAVMRRLDHAGIWLLIAGTFTPVHAIAFRGPMRWGALLGIWTLAIAGLVLKTVFFEGFPEMLGLTLYLILGWFGAVSGVALASRFGSASVRPLILGGVIYSVGGAVSLMEAPLVLPGVIGHHELFHIAVIAAISMHWRFIGSLTRRVSAAPELVVRQASAPMWVGGCVAMKPVEDLSRPR